MVVGPQALPALGRHPGDWPAEHAGLGDVHLHGLHSPAPGAEAAAAACPRRPHHHGAQQPAGGAGRHGSSALRRIRGQRQRGLVQVCLTPHPLPSLIILYHFFNL